jgi:nucleotide-binding universal stress UspA family protein
MLVRAEAPDGSMGEAHDYLKSVQLRLQTHFPDLSVLTVVKIGHPADAIDDALGHSSASLVVMATHGRGGILRSVTGSVAGQVLKQGRAPLVLVRPSPHPDEVTAEPEGARAPA